MFDRLRWQLLLSYLGVFTAILGVFAIAVRLVFVDNLYQSLIQELITLAKVAATYAEIKDRQLIVSDEFNESNVVLTDRAVEWFDRQKKLVNKIGKLNLNQPLNFEATVELKKYPGRKPDKTISVILPIINDDDRQQIGYVRLAQSLESLDRTIHQLDIGLASGMLISIVISGGAGIWLTGRAVKPAVVSYQRLQQFTADAAHELRSPLMAVKTNAGTALKYSAGMRAGDLKKFNAIANATEQIINLTEDLLMLARIENCQDKATEQIDLAVPLQQIAAKYQLRCAAKQITLATDIRANLLVNGYLSSLDRTFINLLENAIYYTPSGGTIRLLAQRSDRQIEISIIDTGVGIAPTDLERIFDRFWRGDRSRTHWEGGSGLGLAIVKSIVEQHHGSIEVQSKLGTGSQFIVRLPAIF